MQASTVLYEPLPIARIGVRLEDQTVVIASDFSTFAYMLEEFITLGAIKIAILKSAPETAQLSQMPELLRKHVRVIDDSNEQEAVERILSPVRAELGVGIEGETRNLAFPDGMAPELRMSITRAHRDLIRLALGFNHAVDVGIDPKGSKNVLRELRKQLRAANSRALIAQIEAVFNVYKSVSFDAPKPNINAPNELITLFDRLVNDASYLEFSEAVGKLSRPQTRRRALARVKEYRRRFMSNPIISASWNFTTKVINAWTGVPIPEASALATLVSDKSFPILADLSTARQRAIEMWLASCNVAQPCNRAGSPYAGDEIYWLPPMKSIRASHPDGMLYCGTVGELKQALENAQYTMEARHTTEGKSPDEV